MTQEVERGGKVVWKGSDEGRVLVVTPAELPIMEFEAPSREFTIRYT